MASTYRRSTLASSWWMPCSSPRVTSRPCSTTPGSGSMKRNCNWLTSEWIASLVLHHQRALRRRWTTSWTSSMNLRLRRRSTWRWGPEHDLSAKEEDLPADSQGQEDQGSLPWIRKGTRQISFCDWDGSSALSWGTIQDDHWAAQEGDQVWHMPQGWTLASRVPWTRAIILEGSPPPWDGGGNFVWTSRTWTSCQRWTGRWNFEHRVRGSHQHGSG